MPIYFSEGKDGILETTPTCESGNALVSQYDHDSLRAVVVGLFFLFEQLKDSPPDNIVATVDCCAAVQPLALRIVQISY